MKSCLVRRRAWLVLCLLPGSDLIACRQAEAPPGVPMVQLDRRSAALQPGDTLRLTLLPALSGGYVPPHITWSSSDTLVATVHAGLVHAMRAGRAGILASGDGASDGADITVGTVWIPVVQVFPGGATLAAGDTVGVFLLPMLPPGYVPTPIDWSSSDTLVASVTPRVKGGTAALVRARRAGSAVITAAGAGASGTSSINVK